MVRKEVSAKTQVVAVDWGKVANRALLASGERGVIGEPVSLSTLRGGIAELERLIASAGSEGPPVIALEATGSPGRERPPVQMNSAPAVTDLGQVKEPRAVARFVLPRAVANACCAR
jgi:hypothetical protein